jgi:DHA1 family tetracycline resistance protein-like MFS transporter
MKFHHRAVPIVLSVALIDAIGFGIVLPVLPSLVVELTELPLTEATRIGGYLAAAYALAQFFAGPILGNLGDSIGRRPVLLFSTFAFAIDYALCAVAPTLAWLFLGRVVAGIAGATFGPANAVLADVTPPEKRGQTFGLMGAAFGTGFLLGPGIGGLMSDFGPRAPFLAAGALAALNAVWIMVALPETMDPEKRRKFDIREAHIIGSFRPLLHAGNAKWLLLAVFFWQFAHMVYPATWAFWAEIAMDWTEKQIGWSLMLSGAGMVVVQSLILGRMLKRFGEVRTAIIGICAGMTVFAGYVFARENWMVFILIAVGALQAMAYPSMNGLLSRMTDPSHQGALQGGMASLMSLTWILAPLVMTQVLAEGAERGFNGGNFALAAGLALVALVIMVLKVVPRVAKAPAP